MLEELISVFSGLPCCDLESSQQCFFQLHYLIVFFHTRLNKMCIICYTITLFMNDNALVADLLEVKLCQLVEEEIETRWG